MSGRRHRGILVIGAAIAVLWSAVAVAAQSPGTSDALVSSLLTAEDVPPGLVSQGIDDPPRFAIDDAAFEANGGQRAVGQVWSSEGTQPIIVFDHRMAFPDADAAAAYLDAAEPVLSEAEAFGLAPVMFEDPIGEHARHYFGTVEQDGATVQLHNYLFHVGPVAAKVFVGGVDVPPEVASTIAAGAVARMETALAGEPVSAPGASAPASPAASASPGASAGASPRASIAAGPTDGLLAHVPASIRDSCAPIDPSGSEIAIVSCRPPDDPPVIYALYTNGIAVDGDFARIVSSLAEPRAATCAEGPYLGVFRTPDDEIVGQLACWTRDGTAYLAAGDKRIPMIVFLLGEDGDLAALEQALPEVAPVP